jgi:hypothetical protein
MERCERIPHNFPTNFSQLYDISSIRYWQAGGAPAKTKRMEIKE